MIGLAKYDSTVLSPVIISICPPIPGKIVTFFPALDKTSLPFSDTNTLKKYSSPFAVFSRIVSELICFTSPSKLPYSEKS